MKIYILTIITLLLSLSLLTAQDQNEPLTENKEIENTGPVENSESAEIAGESKTKEDQSGQITDKELGIDEKDEQIEKTEVPDQEERKIAKNVKGKTFWGRIIYIQDDQIEMKKGRKEIIFYTNTDTIYASKDNFEKSKDTIEICQIAKATFNKVDEKNRLLKITVLKESDCYK